MITVDILIKTNDSDSDVTTGLTKTFHNIIPNLYFVTEVKSYDLQVR